MTEVWLIVTLCLAAGPADSPYGQPGAPLTYQCTDYLSEPSFTSIESCILHQKDLYLTPIEGHRVAATLCTARLSPERVSALPTLRSALGDRA
jgi:hypothetical protein